MVMAKVIQFPGPQPEKFGPIRARKKKGNGLEKHGQLNLFTGGKVIALHQLSLFEEALALDDHGDLESAKSGYLKAIGAEENVADAYCNLAIIEFQQDHHVLAIDYLSRALEINPRHFEAHYNLANVYGEIGNFKLAKAHYGISIQLEPEFANSYFNLGLTLAINKEYNEAVTALENYIHYSPDEDHTSIMAVLDKLKSACN